eukprot:1903380-Pyramimonas_sp.AAC.1
MARGSGPCSDERHSVGRGLAVAARGAPRGPHGSCASCPPSTARPSYRADARPGVYIGAVYPPRSPALPAQLFRCPSGSR